MEPFLLATVISCNQLMSIVNRVLNNKILSTQQKIEIIQEMRNYIPTCPVVIKKDK